nr:hypothetical protein [uncultured Cellulosilyticum sp.]
MNNKPIYKKWWFWIILLLVLSIVSGGYTYYLNNCTFEAKVYNSYEKLMDKYPNPADELQVDDFKNFDAYTETFNELNDAYNKELDDTVSEYYGISVEEATSIYVDECVRRFGN